MIIKVCGMRDAENIRQLDNAGIADWMGFIFFEKSSRHVASLPDYMPSRSKRVGVFVNETIEGIIEKVDRFGFHLVQLHGNESAAFCKQLRSSLPPDVKIIKMLQITSPNDLMPCCTYALHVDYFLFETKCEGYGGSGQQFDWDILSNYCGPRPFILTGGIGPDDVGKIKEFSHPFFAGIDLNSRFEISPAVKDIQQLAQFINSINHKL